MNFLQRPSWRIFLLVFAAGLAWAVATDQAWEDFYITYRASKNLAEGHGLTFTAGERVHSFTSPLGVLLPAASYLLTGRSSDVAALWIFRLMSFAALGGAAVLLWRTLRTLFPGVAPAALLVALLATDNKTLAFSANGMETAFMLLFLGWALWAVFLRPVRWSVHLGLAWGGMMWTRPDSCVYIAAMGAGLLLFRPAAAVPRADSRWRGVFDLGGAAVLCAAVYLPWFAWAWRYYGTPVPHTITAKGLFTDVSLAHLGRELWHFPGTILAGQSSLSASLLFPYGLSAQWPKAVMTFFLACAVLPLVLLVAPRMRWEIRFTALVYAAGHYYITVISGPGPWYLPQVALLGFVVLALAFGQLLAAGDKLRRSGRIGFAPRVVPVAAWLLPGLLVVAAAVQTVVVARQARLATDLVERPVRAAIGLWLKAAARSPHDTVMLEPLGYIGFYSNLKMLDYPGLCSPEMVLARQLASARAYPFCWTELIQMLRPDWVVLRPRERDLINQRDQRVLAEHYDLVKTFDASASIRQARFLPLPGYLENDGVFAIYRLKPAEQRAPSPLVPLVFPISLESFATQEAAVDVEISGLALKAHAPSRLVTAVPAAATLLRGGFGIFDGAYAKPKPDSTDGADFTITQIAADGTRSKLLHRHLDPAGIPGDRGVQEFSLRLPARGTGEVELEISPGPDGNNGFDWTYWHNLQFAAVVEPKG